MADEQNPENPKPVVGRTHADALIEAEPAVPVPCLLRRMFRRLGLSRPPKDTTCDATGRTPPWGPDIAELRALMLEQEHRPPQVYWNAVASFGWDESDPRRSAARRALIWRIFAPATLALGGAGLFTMLTYFELRRQNGFIQAQVAQQSTEYMTTQRASLLATLYDDHPCSEDDHRPEYAQILPRSAGEYCPNANKRAREEAVRALMALRNPFVVHVLGYPSLQPNGARNPYGWLHLASANLDAIDLPWAHLSKLDLNGAVMRNSNFEGAAFVNASIWGADMAGSLLVGANFERIEANSVNFTDANLRLMRTSGLHAFGASFSRADLSDATITHAMLGETDLSDASLRGARLHEVVLTDSTLDRVNFAGADLSTAKLARNSMLGCKYCPSGSDNPTYWPPGFDSHLTECRVSEKECSNSGSTAWTVDDVSDSVRAHWLDVIRAAKQVTLEGPAQIQELESDHTRIGLLKLRSLKWTNGNALEMKGGKRFSMQIVLSTIVHPGSEEFWTSEFTGDLRALTKIQTQGPDPSLVVSPTK